MVGAWWSYHVASWGGYWAWDPVENAAFMPWLPATAFLHSIQVQERRRMLKVWNLSLIIIAFSLTIFGTFLTRSGILSSIHAFSSGPVGIFLGLSRLVLLASFGLLAYAPDMLKEQPELDSMVSRESAFLLNNIVLVSAVLRFLRFALSAVIRSGCRSASKRRRALFQFSYGPSFSLLGISHGRRSDHRLATGFLGQFKTQFSLAGNRLTDLRFVFVRLEGERFPSAARFYLARLRCHDDCL